MKMVPSGEDRLPGLLRQSQTPRWHDLITSQRQTLLVFVGITGMIVPLLVMMIAPIALVMAAAHVLNKLFGLRDHCG